MKGYKTYAGIIFTFVVVVLRALGVEYSPELFEVLVTGGFGTALIGFRHNMGK